MGSGNSKGSGSSATHQRAQEKQTNGTAKTDSHADTFAGNNVSFGASTKEINNPGVSREKTDFELARRRISSAVSRKANVQKKFTRGFSKAKLQARKDKVSNDPLLLGDLSQQFPPTAKIVRIFTSSTFTDTKFERNSWMVNSYPRIQAYCRDHGYEFQVVDMRWGVRDEAADDHSAVDLCLKELEWCQKLSTGPNFVSLLSHKYGYRNLLKQIEAKEFETLIQAVDSEEDKKILTKWYKKDENAVPPLYVLQRISTNLPGFVSPDNDKKNKAKDEWWADSDKMQDVLAVTAEKCFGPEKARNYLVSVTEREVQMGVLDVKNPGKCCIWFRRILNGIEEDTPTKPLSRYYDCLGDEDKYKKSRQLLSELKDDRLAKVLPSKNIVPYNVKWIPGGIDPNNKAHACYLKEISEDLVTHLCDMIDKAITEREKQEQKDSLLEECKQHIVFCQHKCDGFQGREDILQKIKTYITGDDLHPLVIHGSSGCGKTSIMAMAARLTKTQWCKQAAVVCRFLGTTPDSSTVGQLLKSLIMQLRQIYGQDRDVPENLDELKDELRSCFSLPLPDVPLVIFLDSLDQLDASNGGRSLGWLPFDFSVNVKIVVSTLEERQYEAFPKLVSLLPPENFVPIPALSINDAKSIINSWLQSQHRTLTDAQNQIVVKAFNQCPLALYLKLSLDEACQWKSFTSPDHTGLKNTVRASIEHLFQRLEVRYGHLFVSRTLGYLTTAVNGLSESELEDVLSCDDDVLNDMYQYWTPPICRLPPLILVRLKTDLRQYLVDRGADGVRVIYWYHRQFIEAAQDRYCTQDKQPFLHGALADFFAGTWSNGNKKPFTNAKNKTEGSEDRLVAAQPLTFKDSYNYRKLANQPYHRIMSGNVDKTKSECLCNFIFLQTKLIAMSYRKVFRDLNLARNMFEKDEELSLIANAFQLSEYALSHDPYQLTPHMIDRLSREKVVSGFVQQCRGSSHPYLASSDEVLLKPGGELQYTMTGHTSSVKWLDVTDDGKTAVTCGQFGDDIIRTWSLFKGKILMNYDNLPKDPEKVCFADKDKRIMVHYRAEVVIINISDNTRITVPVTDMCQTCVCGPGRSLFGTFLVRDCAFYTISNGLLKDKISFESEDTNLFDIRSLVFGTANYVAITHPSENEFFVINISSGNMSQSRLEDRDVNTVDAIAITPSEKSVVCASYEEPMIWLHDIKTLKVIKVIQTRNEPYEEISNFHFTKDGRYLYFPCYREMIMIDIKEEKETKKFGSHPDSVKDIIIYSRDQAISIMTDPIIRVWDMADSCREKDWNKILRNHRIVDFKPLPNSRYVVILGNPDSTQTEDYYLYVYDLLEKDIVQSTELDEGSHILEVIDDSTVLVLPMSLKPKTIDLETMTIKTVFQGWVCNRCKRYQLIKDGKVFMCVSRGRRNIKVYNTETGKVMKIHKSTENLKINDFYTNRTGSTIVARADKSVEEEVFIVFDITNNKTRIVSAKDLKMEVISCVAAVSPSGARVVLTACKFDASEEWEKEPLGTLWDVTAGKRACQLIDSEYHMKYKKMDSPLTITMDEVCFLDDSRIVTTHDDFIIRVWSVDGGAILHRLTGHYHQAMLTIPHSGPYFISFGFMDEEVIKLWDRSTFKCLSSFKFDTTVGKLRLCSDNETFIISTDNPVNIVHWHLHGNEPKKALKDYPLIQRKNFNLQLEIETEEDMANEPDDPDTDLDEPEDEEEDFNDDDF